MPLVETECLVLRTYSLAEADKIVVMLTRDDGLVRGVAKGSRRLMSKFGSGLEPFSIISVSYSRKENLELVSIRSSELVRSYFHAVSDPENPDTLEKLAYISDLLITFVPPNEPNQKIYRMICGCLNAFATETRSLQRIVMYFEIWLLRLSGYLPEWDRCGDCRKMFESSENSFIQTDFRLKCAACNTSKFTRRFSPEVRRVAAMSRQLSPQDFMDQTADKAGELAELTAILGSLISHVVGTNRSAQAAGVIAG